jgi:uncharacterized protein YacL (UPF0231 family)
MRLEMDSEVVIRKSNSAMQSQRTTLSVHNNITENIVLCGTKSFVTFNAGRINFFCG